MKIKNSLAAGSGFVVWSVQWFLWGSKPPPPLSPPKHTHTHTNKIIYKEIRMEIIFSNSGRKYSILMQHAEGFIFNTTSDCFFLHQTYFKTDFISSF